MGRVDWIQAVQPPMARFCAAALDAELDLVEKRRPFFAAVNNFANTMTQIARGHGFKAHMHALQAMVNDDESLPELFRERIWYDITVSSVKPVKTDCLEGAMLQETSILLPEPSFIFLHHEVEEEECIVFVQAWHDRTTAIRKALNSAAGIIRRADLAVSGVIDCSQNLRW
ncbi:MAG: hypothetical protein LQ339_008164 [Xanthoria mediterranea]|nr:MAG: hypothetical protein LQ339_008164 [Xanthoria mediterranea]